MDDNLVVLTLAIIFMLVGPILSLIFLYPIIGLIPHLAICFACGWFSFDLAKFLVNGLK